MDCKEFNDYLTEYEARKLSKSKEIEFLEHKNSCSECREILDLVINNENLYNFDEFNNEYSENFENNIIIRDTIMDKISDMDYAGYNFRKSNILNIVFGTIFIGIIIVGIMEIGKYPLAKLSNSLYNSVEKFALAFENGSIFVMHTYVHNLCYVAATFILVAFFLSILECRRTKNVRNKTQIKSYKS